MRVNINCYITSNAAAVSYLNMAKRRIQLSAQARPEAVVLRKYSSKPLSYREIGRRCNISKSEEHRLCKGEREVETTEQPKNRKGGRPRNVDERGIRTLIRSI